MADELKPCPNPWCVGHQHLPAKGKAGWRVICAYGVQTFAHDEMSDAVAQWNTRPAPKADSALVGELQAQAIHKESQTVVINRDLRDRILAALSDRDVVLEGLLREAHEMLAWCGGILDEDTKAPAELAARIAAALKGGVDE